MQLSQILTLLMLCNLKIVTANLASFLGGSSGKLVILNICCVISE